MGADPGPQGRRDRGRPRGARAPEGRARSAAALPVGGCCDGSSPMCFPDGELLLGPNDLLLGEVDGTPFYVDAELYQRWNRPAFVLDVAPGAGSGLSLEGAHDLHFRVTAPVAASA